MKALVSVCVPVYNTAKYLEQCLESLFNQTIANKCEFIIVNDCSTDKSFEIISKMSDNHSNLQIKVINHEKNRGLAAARNSALFASTGKYCINIDSDDWVELNYIETMVQVAEEKDADIVISRCNPIQKISDYIYATLTREIEPYIWAKLIKRALFTDNDLSWVEGINVGEDVIISSKLFYYAKNVITISQDFYHYRTFIGFATKLKKICWIEQKKKQLKELDDFFKLKNVYEKYKDILDLKKAEVRYDYIKSANSFSIKKYSELYPEIKLHILSEKREDFCSTKTNFFINAIDKRNYFIANIILLSYKILGKLKREKFEVKTQDFHTKKTNFSKDVSIIIVNYNTKQLLSDCLMSIYEQTKEIDFEVIVSDNGSVDGSIEMLKADFSQVRLIENNENLGFGTANNRGLAIAKGKYIFYLNSDTVLLNNAVKIFFDYFEENGERENIGALGCNLINAENEVSHSYGHFLNINEELHNSIHQLYGITKLSLQKLFFKKKTFSPKKQSKKYIGEVDVIIGADLFIRNDEYAKFDERFFMYHEEQDLQYQLFKHGKKRLIINGPKIIHLEGKSSEKQKDEILNLSSFSNIYCTISMFIFFKKNYCKNFSLKVYVLQILKTLLWLNPMLFRTNGKYIKELFMTNREQRTENREQRTENREQRTENREQRTENREQRT